MEWLRVRLVLIFVVVQLRAAGYVVYGCLTTIDNSLSLNPNRCHHPFITQLRLTRTILGVLKISSILLKLSNFKFAYFHGQNKYKIRVSVHYEVCTKELVKIKWKKTLHFGLKKYFWGSKMFLILVTNLWHLIWHGL